MKTTDDQISVNTARWFEPNTGTFFVFSFFSSLLRQAGGMVSKPLGLPKASKLSLPNAYLTFGAPVTNSMTRYRGWTGERETSSAGDYR